MISGVRVFGAAWGVAERLRVSEFQSLLLPLTGCDIKIFKPKFLHIHSYMKGLLILELIFTVNVIPKV